MDWIAVMDRVGGYQGYLALTADARAFDHVVIAIEAEAGARRMVQQEADDGW